MGVLHRHSWIAARGYGRLQRLLRPRADLHDEYGQMSDATRAVLEFEWDHSVQDAALLVRDFVKWDDVPISYLTIENAASVATRLP